MSIGIAGQGGTPPGPGKAVTVVAADDQATGTAPTRPERDKARYSWLYDDEDIWAVGEEPDVFPVTCGANRRGPRA